MKILILLFFLVSCGASEETDLTPTVYQTPKRGQIQCVQQGNLLACSNENIIIQMDTITRQGSYEILEN